jgi:hypothetical protein
LIDSLRVSFNYTEDGSAEAFSSGLEIFKLIEAGARRSKEYDITVFGPLGGSMDSFFQARHTFAGNDSGEVGFELACGLTDQECHPDATPSGFRQTLKG